MQGRIIRGIAGFYYVADERDVIWECHAKGIFRKKKQKPLVGDLVEFEVTDETDHEASITRLLPRKNALVRPEAANVDQALLLFALRNPDPDESLLDRFLVMMGRQEVPVIICFNKKDLAGEEEIEHWQGLYRSCGYTTLVISAAAENGAADIRPLLEGRTTVVAGPSGAGKSTITNQLQQNVHMETGELSVKLGRGRNTTRRAELVPLDAHTFFCDTPGFTSLDLPDMEPLELQKYFPEFEAYEPYCRFQGCSHVTEPDCGVRQALAEGKIAPERYENYCRFYDELAEKKKHRYS